ncbi:hypothetical protein PI126_g19962 [Phytophthora idaei]|nr:hypothetical protein PI126_g19962 [Phytophthora idaei]
MRVNYDDESGYELDQEVNITDMLKEHGVKLAHGMKAPLGDDWNECMEAGADLLPVTGCEGMITVSRFQSLVEAAAVAGEVHTAGNRFCCP